MGLLLLLSPFLSRCTLMVSHGANDEYFPWVTEILPWNCFFWDNKLLFMNHLAVIFVGVQLHLNFFLCLVFFRDLDFGFQKVFVGWWFFMKNIGRSWSLSHKGYLCLIKLCAHYFLENLIFHRILTQNCQIKCAWLISWIHQPMWICIRCLLQSHLLSFIIHLLYISPITLLLFMNL